ncbi:MAG: hypothetical protein R3E48_00450 [Burkholderiaceae bacterium]
MNRYAKASILAIAIATVGALATQAGARTSENDALAVTRAGISLTRAVTLAEQHAQGRPRAPSSSRAGKVPFTTSKSSARTACSR